MNDIKRYIKYFWYVIKHKWYVFIECCKYNIIWQGIIHDLSKFSVKEFYAYAQYFFPDPEMKICVFTSNIMAEEEHKQKMKVKNDFDYAWLHHQHKNKHHWNYWVIDQYNCKALQIPEKYVKEMVCDWKAMSKVLKDNTALEYYNQSKEFLIIHDETKKYIEYLLED